MAAIDRVLFEQLKLFPVHPRGSRRDLGGLLLLPRDQIVRTEEEILDERLLLLLLRDGLG